MKEDIKILREDEYIDSLSMEELKGGLNAVKGDCDEKCCGLNLGCHEKTCPKDCLANGCNPVLIRPNCPQLGLNL